MKDGLYHKDVGFPADLVVKSLFGLKHSFHAKEAAERWNVSLPVNFIYPRVAQVIEVEILDGKLFKIVARQEACPGLDICYPILVETKLVKTIWVNSQNDKHSTLDKSRFARP